MPGPNFFLEDANSGGTDFLTLATWDYLQNPTYAEGGPTREPGAPAADTGNTTEWGLNNQFRSIGTAITSLKALIDALPGSADRVRLIFVGKHGLDTNSGLRPEIPFLTIGAAITAAAALTPADNSIVAIQVLDGGQYTESVAIPEFVVLNAPEAEIIGNVTMDGGSRLIARKLVSTSGNTVNKNASTTDTTAWLTADEIDVSGGALATGVICTDGVLIANVRQVFVGADSFGVGETTTAQAHMHFVGGDIYCAGNNAVAIARIGSSSTVIDVDHILETGSPTGCIGIFVLGGTINANVRDLNIATAYNVGAGTTLNLFVNTITGTQTAVGTANVSIAGQVGAVFTNRTRVWFVGKHGNDSNSGLTPDQAFLTIGAAQTAIDDGGGGPGGAWRLEILDNADYAENFNMQWDDGEILAPGATIDDLTMGSNDNLHVNLRAANLINCNATNTFSIDIRECGQINLDSNAQGRIRADRLTGSVTLLDITNASTGVELDIGEIVCTGAVPAVNSTVSANVVNGNIDFISAASGTAIQNTIAGALLNLNVGYINASTAYNVTDGTLNMLISNLVGAESVSGSGTANVTKAGAVGAGSPSDKEFFLEGKPLAGEGQQIVLGRAITVSTVLINLGTTPSGSLVRVDVFKNGTSIFNLTPANRPEIANPNTQDESGAPDTTTFVKGDVLSWEVDAADSSNAAEDLTVTVILV